MGVPDQSREASHEEYVFVTPPKLQWLRKASKVNDALQMLGSKSGIKFPEASERESPNKRTRSPTHDIKTHFSELFYTNRELLEREIEDFLGWIPAWTDHEEKVTYLLNKLTLTTKSSRIQATPRSTSRWQPISTSLDSEQNADRPHSAPPSPTMSVKHGPKISAAEAGEIVLPPPSNGAGITSNNTSFATTSFWSEAQQGTQDPPSPATTVESFHSTQESKRESNYGSSWNEPAVANLTDKLIAAEREADAKISPRYDLRRSSSSRKRRREDSQQPSASRKPPSPAESPFNFINLDGVNDSATQETYYGSSQWSRELEEQQERRNLDIAKHQRRQAEAARSGGALTEKERLENASQRIKKIRSRGLTTLKFPASFKELRFDLQWEAYRVLQTGAISSEDLEQTWKAPRSMQSLHEVVKQRDIPFHKGEETDFKGVTLYAKLRWPKPEAEGVFRLELSPPKKELSDSFQRKYGADRLLYIDVPSLYGPPNSTGLAGLGLGGDIVRMFKEMLTIELPFLGRIWRQFHVQPKDHSPKDPDFAKPGVQQFFFFAERGNDISDIAVDRVLNWAVPFRENRNQYSCKAFARLDLLASRTRPTLILRRDQIRFVDDHMPDDAPDDTTFNDPEITFTNTKSKDPLNDGCSRISRWAMVKIAAMLDLNYVPSAIQARLFGAKGVWYIDEEDPEFMGQEPEILIEITKSQIKVKQKEGEFQHDDEKLTINVVDWSRPARNSVLFPDLLPILTDRGVSKNAIAQLIHRQADHRHRELLAALSDGEALESWIYRETNLRKGRTREEGIEEMADFPRASGERLVKMLDSGFEPTLCDFASGEAFTLAEQDLALDNKNARLRCDRSTMLLGISDPLNCLKPGEAHVSFSQSVSDSLTKESWEMLQNTSGLVARLPALGACDVQRVRFVFKPELAHIRDVAVFPRVGPCSLASKLQGGDYDGDRFWLCWEQSLVLPFKNAPVPVARYSLSDLRIKVDEKKLDEFLPTFDGDTAPAHLVHRWIAFNTSSRMRFDLLGRITLEYGKQTYKDNKLSTPQAEVLLCLHDHMIDADKRGLIFSSKDFEELMKKHGIDNMPGPAHWRFTRSTESLQDNGLAPINKDHIVDYVFYEILQNKVRLTLKEARRILNNASAYDEDLTRRYDNTVSRNPPNPRIMRELEGLGPEFSALRKKWNSLMQDYRAEKRDFESCVKECRAAYLAIMPQDLDHFTMEDWLLQEEGESSMWAKLKASALAKSEHKGKMMFYVAFDELCWLKGIRRKTRLLSMKSYLGHAPTRKRKGAELDVEDAGEYGDDAGFDDLMVE